MFSICHILARKEWCHHSVCLLSDNYKHGDRCGFRRTSRTVPELLCSWKEEVHRALVTVAVAPEAWSGTVRAAVSGPAWTMGTEPERGFKK